MYKILANDGMAQSAIEELVKAGYDVENHFYEGDALIQKIKEVDCIVIRSATKIREPLIDEALKTGTLKLIIRAGVGIDNIDHAYAKSKGIMVRNTPNSSSDAVAELTIGHMFSLARHLYISNVTMREGKWNKKQYQGIELAGKKLGLIGFGRIAKSVAKKAMALGMTVNYTDLFGPMEHDLGCQYLELKELLASSDFISLHIPFSKETGATIGEKEFKMMKKGMYLINAARGGVVDEEALLVALDNGIVKKAALDVFMNEPTKNERIYTHESISLSPHIGASTVEAQERIGFETIDVIKEILN